MKQNTRRTYVFWILLSEAIGLLSAILSRAGTESFRTTVQQPPLSPTSCAIPHRVDNSICPDGYQRSTDQSDTSVNNPKSQSEYFCHSTGCQFLLESHIFQRQSLWVFFFVAAPALGSGIWHNPSVPAN